MPAPLRVFATIIGGLVVVGVSFWATLAVLDYWNDTSTNPASATAPKILVLSATYGGNCVGVTPGNVTRFLKSACDSKEQCEYKVDYKVLGDPAPCKKEFWADYTCAPATDILKVFAPGEAGLGTVVQLSCEGQAKKP